ncbi:alpha/beta hydrolase [Henriciella barbarensis]|uniref:Palmitoyl-protein thioesterase ABHD10, mitochondrial n=1 Tax=Henriciella barbarensis TaxID=86342 RepID=A0A399QYS1_9PROT|nr:alpha/beta hydrolase [Henriciella barbarensis]RIJ23681.1 alpha/beta hydrolase [Henriciella barbarensis]
MTTQYFETPQHRRIAFRRSRGASGLTYVWLSGFKSDMLGGKVTELEKWSKAQGHGFLAFDYSGHGQSGGAFEDGTISAWREDALAAITAQTEGNLILVGSSMGGWMALLSMMALPERVKGLVLIAPAPDFTEKLMWPEFSREAQAEITETGMHLRPSDYGDPYPITRALIEDGKTWSILDKPISFDGPVRILQGMQDPDVPWKHAERLVTAMTSEDLVFHLIKDGDHRLSRPQDIARLKATCGEIAEVVRTSA